MLILVPTPLGNLRDITLRALDVLRGCDLIAAEDTRTARRLLSAHAISGKTIVRHDRHSSPAAIDALLEKASSGCVAVTCDAGMPGISDPGHALIRRAQEQKVQFEVLPGGTAFVCAALLSGFPITPLVFAGFLPRAGKERTQTIGTALQRGITTVWYESPRRLATTLETIAREAPEARVFVARELTKKFEQHLAGSAAQILAALPSPLKGEITLVVHAIAPTPPRTEYASSSTSLHERIDTLLSAGETTASIAKALSSAGMGERKAVYALASERRRRMKES